MFNIISSGQFFSPRSVPPSGNESPWHVLIKCLCLDPAQIIYHSHFRKLVRLKKRDLKAAQLSSVMSGSAGRRTGS